MWGIGFVTDYVTSIQQAFTEHLVTMLWAGHWRNRDRHTPIIKYGMELSILTGTYCYKVYRGDSDCSCSRPYRRSYTSANLNSKSRIPVCQLGKAQRGAL